MHSIHATGTAQAAADALKPKPTSPLLLAIDTDANPTPHVVSVTQDTILPDTPTTAAAGDKDWTIFEGTVARKRKHKEKNGKEGLAVNVKKYPTNSGNKGNARRTLRKDTRAQKTWVDIVKAGGINVQIRHLSHTEKSLFPFPFPRLGFVTSTRSGTSRLTATTRRQKDVARTVDPLIVAAFAAFSTTTFPFQAKYNSQAREMGTGNIHFSVCERCLLCSVTREFMSETG